MRKLFFLLSLSLFIVPAFAQVTSSVQGSVTDSSGALVPGAAVSLTNDATGIVLHTTTNEAGQYRFLSLALGNYTVAVTANGFEQATVKVMVQTGETAGVDVTLKVAVVGQNVTVTSEAPTLNPEETRVEYTLEAQDIENLPSQEHGTLNFIKLAPGVTTFTAGDLIEGFSDLSSNRNNDWSSANGLGPTANLYILDNVPINSTLNQCSVIGCTNGAVIFVPNPDSLAEMSLQTTTFNVDYGTAASMQISMATKSGSNTFHGSGDWGYNDRILNAPAWQQSNTVANHRNIDSFAGGGPIIKNHTFFFGSYEHIGTYGAGSGTDQWWSPEFQTFIASADSTSVNVNKFLLPNNPGSRLVDNGLNPVTAQTIFGTPSTCQSPTDTVTQFNIPCSMRVTYEGVASAPGILTGKLWNIRGDHTWNNSKDRIYVFYYSMDQNSNSESPNPTWDGETPTNGYDFTTNYTHSFNSNLLNSATFALTQFNFAFTDTPHSTLLLQMPFLLQIYDAGSINGFTRYVPFTNTERQIYGRDALLWTKGKHSFAFGMESANNYETDSNYVFGRPFIYAFNTTLDFLTDTLDSETVLSHYSAVTGNYQPFVANGVVTRYGLYAEDSWKITQHLTVNYGMRWDDLGNPSPYSGSNAWANTIFNGADSPAQIAASIVSRTVTHALDRPSDLNFLPRGGFAWTPPWFKGARQFVVRGGAGLYQNVLQLENITSVLPSNPPYGDVGATFTPTTAEKPILSYGTQSTSAPYGFVYPAGPIGTFNPDGSSVGAQDNLAGNDPKLPIPKSIIWNLAVEKELPGKIVFALNYTGSHSYNQTFSSDLNRPAGSDYCTIGGVKVLPNGTTCTNPTYYPANPDWGTITPERAGTTANYNGLIAQVQQRWHTLNWQGSYVWSHTLDVSSIELQYNPQAGYGNSYSDVRQHFAASYSYDIPVPKRWQEALGGWSLNGEVIAQTGLHFTPGYSDPAHDFTGSGGNGSYFAIPDYTGTKRSGWSKSQFKAGIFSNLGTNPSAAFPAPTCGICIGNVGQNTFVGAGYATWDQSLVHKITLPWFGDGKSVLSLRAQAFNSLNKVNFNPQYLATTINTGNFGQTTSAFQGRVIDLGARFEF